MVNEAIVGGKSRKVELESQSKGRYQIEIDGQRREIDVELISDGVYSILLDGRHYECAFQPTEEGYEVVVDGLPRVVELPDPRRSLMKGPKGAAGGQKVLRSPMPGKVVKLLVAEGDEVSAGAGVIVVEAMKMQNELKAPGEGKIGKIFVQEGQNVEANAKLLAIA